MTWSQIGPYPLTLSTPPPFECSGGGSPTLKAASYRLGRSVSGLLNPQIARLTTVKAGSSVFLLCAIFVQNLWC